MESHSLIGYLFIGAIAGWLAGKIMQGGGFGFFVNIVVGIIGAVIGGLVFELLGVQVHSFLGSLITAVVGAAILLFVAGLLRNDGGR